MRCWEGRCCKIAQTMKKILVPLVACAFLLTACVPSLHPLYTKETTVFREELIGIWKEKPQEEDDASWTFQKGEEKSYKLTIQNKEAKSHFDARLVKLGEHLFLDLQPDGKSLEDAKVEDFYKAALVPGHLIIKVKLGEKLEMQLLEQDYIKNNPKALAHTIVDSDRVVITASTAELQAFMKKHAETDELWGDPGVMQKLLL